MKENINYILFTILRSVFHNHQMSDTDKHLITKDILPKLMKIAQKHDIAHLVALGLLNNKLVTAENKRQIQQFTFMATYRYEQLNYEFNRLCEAFEQAKIPFVPLKGSILRKYYPEPWMRTSCDIDILVKNADLLKARELLIQSYNYRFGIQGSHDISLFSISNIHIELHFTLLENNRIGKADNPLIDIWDKVLLTEKKQYQYKMPDEYLYYYHIAHMAKHFLIGGCGIRPVLDLYILNHNIQFNQKNRKKLLEEGGLLKFAQQIELLSEVWFGSSTHTVLSKNIQDYIISGGVYGSMENNISICQAQKGSYSKYIISRIWIPYRDIKCHYPILQRHTWLLPLYEIKRWLRLISYNRLKKSIQEIKMSSNINHDKVSIIKNLLEQLGL